MDGILIIDKPAGLTSHDVVARVRRILRFKRVGHTGTLDPFATGVMVVLVGGATRLAQFMSGAEKEYEAVVRFGYATETGDATGKPKGEVRNPAPEVLNGRLEVVGPKLWTADEIESALAGLRGEIEQVPPMYSAKKVGGEKLYVMARRGEEIERRAEHVTIHRLEIMDLYGAALRRNEDGTRELSISVVCSAGTYIRVLAEAIGERLGSPAHLSALRRTRAGQFKIAQAITLDQLEERAGQGDRTAPLISPEAALSGLPMWHLTTEDARRARHGMSVRVSEEAEAQWREGEQVGMLEHGTGLIAVGVYDAGARLLRPRVVIAAAE